MDKMWKKNCIQEKSYFIMFTVFTVCMMVILKPNEETKNLSDFQELLDETLQTEMPTVEDAEASPEPLDKNNFDEEVYGTNDPLKRKMAYD